MWVVGVIVGVVLIACVACRCFYRKMTKSLREMEAAREKFVALGGPHAPNSGEWTSLYMVARKERPYKRDIKRSPTSCFFSPMERSLEVES